MLILTVQLELPAAFGGSRDAVELPLHAGYGTDPGVAHEILGVTLSAGDDAWARIWDDAGEMVALPRDWVRAWSTRAAETA